MPRLRTDNLSSQSVFQQHHGALPSILVEHAQGTDTMRAWERFLTGDSPNIVPSRNFVVASWLRSQELGIDPTGRCAPLAVSGDEVEQLRWRHQSLMSAASRVFAGAEDLFDGAKSIMLLTNIDGIVLDAAGDRHILEQGQKIHLMSGGDWRENSVGTNGIGTALATGRPAQVHGAEHFCEGIKGWTCAAAPIFEPGTGAVLGVLDISGPPATYQRSNLALAVATARQIEMVLAERANEDRLRLLETCLENHAFSDIMGMMVIDRQGRLIHRAGRLPVSVPLGQRLPGIDAEMPAEHWAEHLPEGLRAEWFNPVRDHGRTIGAILAIPGRNRLAAERLAMKGSEADPARSDFTHIVGGSAAMSRVVKRARQLAGKRVPVLIEGETGTGKELFARAIHGVDGRSRPFIAFNCGAVGKELLAGELFGHVRGAFTGATNEGRPGRFELADGGTLCLDEIGELPLDLQPYLLRVLEEGVVYRLGDLQPRQVDVRILALTNRDLLDDVATGRFRRDLYYRIGVTSLCIPPLRDRDGDVELLIDHFNRQLAVKHGVAMRCFSPEIVAALKRYGWPGNIRELRNVVEGMLVAGETEDVSMEEFYAVTRERPSSPDSYMPAVPPASMLGADGPVNLDTAERELITQALKKCNNKITDAANMLGISRSTLYRKLSRYEGHR